MEKTEKYTKEMYRKEIVKEGKSISDIALERGKTRSDIRKEIRSLYIRRAYADQLIGIADANEASQKLLVSAPMDLGNVKKNGGEQKASNPTYAMRLAYQVGMAVVDTSYAMDFFDDCRAIKRILMPRFCLNELRNIAAHKNSKERTAILRKIKFFEKHAEILYVDPLPYLSSDVRERDFKQRNIKFAQYVQYVWLQNGEKVPYLTRAYEAKTIIKEYVSI